MESDSELTIWTGRHTKPSPILDSTLLDQMAQDETFVDGANDLAARKTSQANQ